MPLLHGQTPLSTTAAQVDIPDSAAGCVAFSIKAPLSNAHPAYVGAVGVTTGTGYQLDPGDELTYERVAQNGQPTYQLTPSSFFVIGTAGDKVTWLASQ